MPDSTQTVFTVDAQGGKAGAKEVDPDTLYDFVWKMLQDTMNQGQPLGSGIKLTTRLGQFPEQNLAAKFGSLEEAAKAGALEFADDTQGGLWVVLDRTAAADMVRNNKDFDALAAFVIDSAT